MKAPWLARFLMWLVLPPSEREFFLGDLDEGFQQQLAGLGLRRARRWYWRQVFEAPGWWFRTSPDFAPPHAEVEKGEIMLSLVQDFRYACRSFAKSPSLTVLALAALALGIGANTAVFSVVNGILLKPLPYSVPERLVRLWDTNPSANLSSFAVAPGNFFAWQQQNSVFDGIGAYREDGFSIGSAGDAAAERINGARVTAGLLPALGVSPLFGRWFTVEEDRPGAARVVLLGHDLWQRRFAGDRDVVGRAIRIEGEPYTVLGVMPPGFRVPLEGAEIWVPYALDPAQTDRSSHFLRVLARLKSSATAEHARADLNRIAERLDEGETQSRRGMRALILPLTESITGDVGRSLWIMLGAVGLVLLIASANVANLLLARSVTRRREIALRLSLGASRGRLFRQLLIESLVLSLVGGGAGFVIASFGIRVLRAQAPTSIPRLADVSLSVPVLAFTALVSIATGLLFGVVPALRGSRVDLGDGLKVASRGTTAGRRDRAASRVLVVAQITIAMVVVVSSGLMLRTLWNLHSVDPGFQTGGRFTFGINLNGDRYGKAEARARFIATLIERLRAIPGVRNAGATHRLPMMGNSVLGMEIEDRPLLPGGQRPSITYRSVTSDYFSVMGIPLLRGRPFDRRESEAGGPVVIVNQRMASQFWPGEDPVGKRMRSGPNSEWLTVVGVVADSKESTLDAEARIGMYLPYFNTPVQAMTVIVDASNSPDSIAGLIVPEIQKLDRDLAIATIRPLADVVDASIGERSFTAALLTVFAGIALLLASSGLYGVLAYAVNQRVREIGVRMALGATRSAVLKQIVGDGVRLILPGILIGSVAALAAARLLSNLLFGVEPEDPLTFLVIAAFLALTGVLACLIPARRAASIDPIVALRNE